MKTIRTTPLIVALTILFILAAGCQVNEQWRQRLEVAAQTARQLDETVRTLEAQLGELEEEERPELVERIREDLIETRSMRDEAVRRLEQLAEASGDGQIDAGEAGAIATGIVNTIAPGYGGIVGIALTGIYALIENFRRRKTQKAAEEVVLSVEHALKRMPEGARESFKGDLSEKQATAASRRLVKTAKGG